MPRGVERQPPLILLNASFQAGVTAHTHINEKGSTGGIAGPIHFVAQATYDKNAKWFGKTPECSAGYIDDIVVARSTSCVWSKHEGKAARVGNGRGDLKQTVYKYGEARMKCLAMGPTVCQAVTCLSEGCTLHAGSDLYPSERAQTYVPAPSCGFGNVGLPACALSGASRICNPDVKGAYAADWCVQFRAAGFSVTEAQRVGLAGFNGVASDGAEWTYDGVGTKVLNGAQSNPCSATGGYKCAGADASGSTYGSGVAQAAAVRKAVANGGVYPGASLAGRGRCAKGVVTVVTIASTTAPPTEPAATTTVPAATTTKTVAPATTKTVAPATTTGASKATTRPLRPPPPPPPPTPGIGQTVSGAKCTCPCKVCDPPAVYTPKKAPGRGLVAASRELSAGMCKLACAKNRRCKSLSFTARNTLLEPGNQLGRRVISNFLISPAHLHVRPVGAHVQMSKQIGFECPPLMLDWTVVRRPLRRPRRGRKGGGRASD